MRVAWPLAAHRFDAMCDPRPWAASRPATRSTHYCKHEKLLPTRPDEGCERGIIEANVF